MFNVKSFIIPVIDIRDGMAVAGERDCYRGLESILCNSSDPLALAKRIQGFGFREIYVADLDGILDSKPDLDLLRRMSMGARLSIMADVGVWEPDDLVSVQMDGIKPVIASESFSSLNLLQFPRDFILSIDTRDGKLLSAMDMGLDDFIDIVAGSNKMKTIIIMDLARTGISGGPNVSLCMKVLRALPERRIIYGGGIRYPRDIRLLVEVGISAVLVGSALHEGRIPLDGVGVNG